MATTLTLDGANVSIPTARDTSWDSTMNPTLTSVIARLTSTGKVINPKGAPYFAKGDGTTDDTAALQAAINDGISQGRAVVADGTFKVTSTVLIDNCYGLRLQGLGAYGLKLQWAGTSGIPMVKVRNAQHVTLDHVGFIGNATVGNRPSAFIESASDTTVSRTFVPTARRVVNCELGNADNQATDGIVFSNSGTGSDTNNDFGWFENVRCYLTTTRAQASITHSQSVEHQFTNCFFLGGQYGISNGLSGNGGGFRVRGGGYGSHSVADFQVVPQGAQQACTIFDVNSEGSNRFLVGVGTNNNGHPVQVRGVRFACNALNADNRWILFQSAGPLDVENCNLDGGNPPRIYVQNGASNSISVTVRNNNYTMVSSDTLDPVEFGSASNGYYKVTVDGNTGRTAGDVARAIPSYIRTSDSNTKTWDPPNVVSGASTTTTIAIASAAMGDHVDVSFDRDLQGMILTGYVSVAGTVTAVLANLTGGALDLASGTLKATIRKVGP